MAWKCSLDDRDEAVAWLALWGPNILREGMKAGQKPSFDTFKERIKADFGELAAEALARPAYEETLRQMAAMVRSIPALEVMRKGGKAAGGPDMVPAGDVNPLYQTGYQRLQKMGEEGRLQEAGEALGRLEREIEALLAALTEAAGKRAGRAPRAAAKKKRR